MTQFKPRQLTVSDRGFVASTWLRKLGKRTHAANQLCIKAIDHALDCEPIAIVCSTWAEEVIVGWRSQEMLYIPKDMAASYDVINELLNTEFDRLIREETIV